MPISCVSLQSPSIRLRKYVVMAPWDEFLASVNSRLYGLQRYILITANTFAICYRRSVCLSVVCMSVTFVQPTQPVEIFRNFSSLFGTLAICWNSLKILQRSGDLNARWVAKYSDFWHLNAITPKRTNGARQEGEMAIFALFLPNLVISRAY